MTPNNQQLKTMAIEEFTTLVRDHFRTQMRDTNFDIQIRWDGTPDCSSWFQAHFAESIYEYNAAFGEPWRYWNPAGGGVGKTLAEAVANSNSETAQLKKELAAARSALDEIEWLIAEAGSLTGRPLLRQIFHIANKTLMS